jgi:hypothetical protein
MRMRCPAQSGAGASDQFESPSVTTAGIRRADRLRRACRVATAGGMTGRVEQFDASSGGSYRLVLA